MGVLSRVAGPAVLAFLFLSALAAGQADLIRNPVSIQTAPGDVQFTLTATLQVPLEGLILTERLPHQWEIVDASPPMDKAIGQERKWLFFQRGGVPNASISYTLRIPPEASGTYLLSGEWEAVAPDGARSSGTTEGSTLFVAGGGTGSGGGGGGGGASTSTASGTDQAPTTLPPSLCAPNLRICQGNSTLQCSPDGRRWDVLERCPHGCSSGACLPSP
ncbi:MAG: hypothetical protein HY520_05280, partial [Candidatus Aenigmarchaeota archaeon]|nr:hypothetical protein [Candidatus Aenigmarchaeota archaeon]